MYQKMSKQFNKAEGAAEREEGLDREREVAQNASEKQGLRSKAAIKRRAKWDARKDKNRAKTKAKRALRASLAGGYGLGDLGDAVDQAVRELQPKAGKTGKKGKKSAGGFAAKLLAAQAAQA